MSRFTAWATSKVEEAETSRTGEGPVVLVFTAQEECFVHEVVFHPLGNNSDCVGRVFVGNRRTAGDIKRILAAEVDIDNAATSQTVAITGTVATVDTYLAPGQSLYVSVSVDLTAESGYAAMARVGRHRSDFYAA